ncbi:MAG: hypothetical protein LBG44_06365 [Gemmatimonadota bacterium]|jgi:uncharacterized membrane protein|nr:hypothetical protein [Gemmatimonadota bacterium]
MNAHLFIIHFPVSLAVIAAGLDLFGIAMDDRSLRDWSWRFLLMAAIAVFLAFATGEGAELAALGSGGVPPVRVARHAELGSIGVWGVIGAALLRTLWRKRTGGLFSWLNLAAVLIATGLLIAITFTGTLVRHGG